MVEGDTKTKLNMSNFIPMFLDVGVFLKKYVKTA